MRSDLTTDSPSRQPTEQARKSERSPVAWRRGGLSFMAIVRLLGAMALGALLVALVYQIPAVHDVDIGGYDAAYAQGFYDPEPTGARWTRDVSYLLFPQAGLPAQATLRLHGRTDGPPTEVAVLLHTGLASETNGVRELGRIRPGTAWEDHTFTIDSGLLKPNDVVIELRTNTAPLTAEDPRAVGVLLDRAIYRTNALPIVPYPAQLLYGALASGMLYLLVRRTTNDERRTATIGVSDLEATERSTDRGRWWFGVGLAVLCLSFLLVYRLQPVYPYPLRRLLPAIDLGLAALLALRCGPAVTRRLPRLLDVVALGGIGVWAGALLLAARNHVTLSIPGVENDFGVFARRSAQLAGRLPASGVYDPATDGVLRADGFYNLGYPLLLWLVRPLTNDNPFLAARLIATLSGALLLGATWWLARRMLGRGSALLALLILAFSPLVVEYGLYLGSDMPFAALCALALALILMLRTENHPEGEGTRPRTGESQLSVVSSPLQQRSQEQTLTGNAKQIALVILAGLIAGVAFLVRHPGLLLLPLGWLALWRGFSADRSVLASQQSTLRTRSLLLFTIAFLLAITPQLLINIRDTGQPLYSQQAKNIWLCVYGSCDWGRWDDAPNNVTLSDVVLRDPGRFLASWWANIRDFFGTGSEDTSEFGRAIQLRLLGFPANWLALGGLLAWVIASFRRPTIAQPIRVLLLIWIGLYVLTVCVGIALPRFFLPLVPVYALAAAWTITRLEPRTTQRVPDREPHGTINEQSAERIEQKALQPVSRFRFHTLRFTSYVLRNIQPIAAMLLLICLWNGFAIGTGYVLRNQPEDEAAAVQLVQATLRPGERVVVRAPPRVAIDTASAIAHLVVPEKGQYLLSSAGSSSSGDTIVGSAGQYTLYRIAP
jgi:4-amino-4-deoxy-L-arabinose transferase-like glycosyltransferase